MNKMKKLILASNNQHKIDEIKKILKELPIEIKSLKEENIFIDVDEDGKTFEENAKKKAVEIAEYLTNRGEIDFIIMSDDSGLAVDYLNGEPGIYSARYAGDHGNDRANNIKLLEKLEGVSRKDRGAKFVCALALVDSKSNYTSIIGEVRGVITEVLPNEDGFGYDPIFLYEPLGKTFAQLAGEEKNKISHRGVALEKMKTKIAEIL